MLAAAAELFSRSGFGATSVREIAAAADVDPAIVIRHFGSKEALFLRAMQVDERFTGLVDGPTSELGRELLRRLFERSNESSGRIYGMLVRALDRPDVRDYISGLMQRHLVAPIVDRLEGQDRELRAHLIAAQLNGLMLSIGVLDDPVLAAIPLSDVLDSFAPSIQALIDGGAAGRTSFELDSSTKLTKIDSGHLMEPAPLNRRPLESQ